MADLISMVSAAAGAGSRDPAENPNFNQVVLLLNGDGTNGAQNNTFIDSSSNNFTITRNGNTTQGSFSPYGNRWSNYFDGSGDYLTAPSNAALNLTSGDFTIEGWAYLNSNSSFTAIVQKDWTPAVTFPQYAIYVNNSNILVGAIGNVTSAEQTLTSTVAFPLNSWVHFAFVLSGTTLSLYQNGVLVQSATKTATIASSTNPLVIGSGGQGTTYLLNGYLSDLRIIKGTALYTSNFTPPTAPLTAVTNTVLLSCQSNRFKDNSSNNFTITGNGDVKVTSFSPYQPTAAYDPAVNGGSGYFDGTGDYLNAPDSSAIIGAIGNFTAETWFYSKADSDQILFYLGGNTIGTAGCRVGVAPDNTVYLLVSTNGFSWQIISGVIGNAFRNSWNHIAVVRDGGTFRLFLNGTQIYSSTAVGSGTSLFNGSLNYIGAMILTDLKDYFNGYISNLRVVNGTALYTSNFTPPTAPLTAVSGTSLLCNFTNAGIFDNTGKNNLETVGNAQISTSVKKYGTGSLAFDGIGDRLVLPNTPDIQFGTGNFTIELWAYVSGGSSYRALVAKGNGTSPGSGWAIFIDISGNWAFTDKEANIISTVPASSNTWVHLALVRSGTTSTLYVNGTSATSATVTTDYNETQPLIIGDGRALDIPFTGYIDELRITKGVARYTANFTPPDAPFTDL
jgi:hypothetical protein